MIFPDQSTLIAYQDLDATCEGIARISPRDAETYRRFAQRAMAMLPMFGAGMYAPPTPMGAFVAMLDSSEEGREMLDAMQRSSLDIANQSFESENVKIWLLRLVSENLQLPDELGTGLRHVSDAGPDARLRRLAAGRRQRQAHRGAGALYRALRRRGALQREVTKILTSGGRATGVRLATGEEIQAQRRRDRRHPSAPSARVSSTACPSACWQRAERATLAAFSIMVSHYDLKRAGTVLRRRGSRSRHHAGVHGERSPERHAR